MPISEAELLRTAGMATRKVSPDPKGEKKIRKVMHEFKEGSLKSSSGEKVKERKQAVAIALSEARHDGAKVGAPKDSH